MVLKQSSLLISTEKHGESEWRPCNSTSGQKEICSSADRLTSSLICVISAHSDPVLTQGEKSLPSNPDKSDGGVPTGKSEGSRGKQLLPFVRDGSFGVVVGFFFFL